MVKGLERVRENHNVFRLQQELHAWNIDGSSVNKPEVGSWIRFWEHSTGRSRTRCAFSDCPKQAEHGGHVWIKGHSSVSRGICWVVTICAKCNSCRNPDRMQNSVGNHSRLRVGSFAVRTAYTSQMASTERRIAMDYTYDEVDNGYVTDDYDFMEAELVDLTEDDDRWLGARRRSSGGWQPSYSPRRRCACGADISDKPPNYTKCEGCHYGNMHLRQRAPTKR